MTARRYVAYYRVSTKQQGASGLGLQAQRMTVCSYLKTVSGEMVAEFTEIESGRKNDRAQLKEALRICRVYSAVLVIAKMDRFARNVALTSGLMESGVEFVAADFPEANRLTIHILAAIAEYEAIGSPSTKAGRWASSRGSGRAGRRSARSGRAKRRTICSPS